MEKDGYKSIKDILQNPPDFPFEEAQWEKLAKQMDEPEEDSTGIYWQRYAWLLLLGLPFLMATIWAGKTIQSSKQQIATLQKRLQQTTISTDSIIHRTITVYQYDTIYQTVSVRVEQPIVYKKAAPTTAVFASIATASQQLGDPFYSYNKAEVATTTSTLTPIIALSLGDIRKVLTENGTYLTTPALRYNEEAIKQPLTAIDRITTPLVDLPLRELGLFQFYDIPEPIIQPTVNPLVFLQPTGLSIGGEGSLLKLMNIEGGGKKGFTVGGAMELHFGKNVRMFLGAEYLQVQHEVDSEGSNLSKYPLVLPDNGQDVFQYVRVRSKYLQIPFGFSYHFNSRSSFKPYIGLGAVSRKHLEHNLDYEYIGMREEYYLNRVFPSNKFSINSIRSNIGTTYQLGKHWQIYLEGMYDHDFRKSSFDFEKVKYFNLRTGFLYQF